jgi:hypothetical protein
MEEYNDTVYRARRLAISREAALANSGSAMDSVTIEDLLVYTRWLVCHMHSVKRINSFLRVCFKVLNISLLLCLVRLYLLFIIV